jgi:glyoxylase-like metal-dependent hydrolase (beta-lactamase superfamily II)
VGCGKVGIIYVLPPPSHILHSMIQNLSDIYLLDTEHLDFTGTVGVYLVPSDKGFALIETGAGSTLETVKKSIAELGLDLLNLKAILVTHIHLDHAGAAGQLVAETGATLYVHERGAPHLIDPSRLLASAERIYGEKMQHLWGRMLPAPAEKVVTLKGGERLNIVGHDVEVIYTPGHASHHVSFLLNDEAMFTGDAAAIRFEGSPIIRPALPPPDIDLETWRDSVQKMIEAKPERLLLTHYGEVQDAENHLRQVIERNDQWTNVILEGMQNGEDAKRLEHRLRDLSLKELGGSSPGVIQRHRMTSNDEMTVMGVTRYWQKHHPEKISSK